MNDREWVDNIVNAEKRLTEQFAKEKFGFTYGDIIEKDGQKLIVRYMFVIADKWGARLVVDGPNILKRTGKLGQQTRTVHFDLEVG